MNRTLTLVTALGAATTLTLATIPSAWACGGGSDGGSSSGSSGGGGSNDSSSSSGSSGYSGSVVESAPPCVDPSDIHGYRTCTGYGSWRARRVSFAVELALTSTVLDLSGIEAVGDISHDDGTSYRYRVVSEDLGGDEAAAGGLSVRALFYGRHIYGGQETGFAVVSADGADRMDFAERTVLAPRVTSAITSAAVLGVRSFAGDAIGIPMPITLGGELAGGVRMISVNAESTHGACIVNDSTVHIAPVLEARLRAELWLSPRVAFGVWGGTELVSGAPSAGLVLSSHVRAFDGAR